MKYKTLLMGVSVLVGLTGHAEVLTPGTPYSTTQMGQVRVVSRVGDSVVDQYVARNAFCFAQKLYPTQLHSPPLGNIYYVNFSKKEIKGLTVRTAGRPAKYIFIKNDLAIEPNDQSIRAYTELGITLAHESDHYFTDSQDPETGSRIDDAIYENLRKAQNQKSGGICNTGLVSWKMKNTADQMACSCGIDLSGRGGPYSAEAKGLPFEPLAAQQAATSVEQLLKDLRAVGIKEEELGMLKESHRLFLKGELAEAQKSLILFSARYDAIFSKIMRGDYNAIQFAAMAKYGLEGNLEESRKAISFAVRKIGTVVFEAAKTGNRLQKLDWIETTLRAASQRRSRIISESAESIDASLARLATYLRTAPLDRLKAFRSRANDFVSNLTEAAEALGNRWGSTPLHASYIDTAVTSFIQTGKFMRSPEIETPARRAIFDSETRETYLREVWVNRDTVSAAIAVLTVGYGGLATLAGKSAAAAVPTLFKKGIEGGLRVAATAMAAGNLLDIVRFQGAGGLLSFGALMDSMVILAVIPKPALQWMRGLESSSRLARVGARVAIVTYKTQYQAGIIAAALGTGYGGWMIANRKKLVLDCESIGQKCSESDFIAQGVAAMTMGLIGGFQTYREARNFMRSDPVLYNKILNDPKYGANLGPVGKRIWESSKRLRPWVPPMRAYKDLVALKKAAFPPASVVPRPQPSVRLKAGAMATEGLAGKTFSASYNAFLYGAYSLVAFTYPDFMFRQQVTLPVLRPGEIALNLSGFDPTDILYYADQSAQAMRRELRAYKEGVNYFNEEFGTPEEFIQILERYSSTHGKIRYLRLNAHGLPGTIATRAIDPSGKGNNGLINAAWVQANIARLRALGKSSFAKDAVIELDSCLVGGRLNERVVSERAGAIEKNASDQFITAFGNALLPHGGDIHTSKFMLLMVESAYGGGLRALVDRGFVSSGQGADELDRLVDENMKDFDDRIRKNPKLAQKMRDLQERLDTLAAKPKDGKTQAAAARRWDTGAMDAELLKEVLYNMVHKTSEIFKKLGTILHNYGTNVDSSFFYRHRVDHFPQPQ